MRRLAIPLTLAVLAAVGTWIHLLLTEAQPPLSAGIERPSFTVREVRITELTPAGAPSRVLEAAELRHFESSRITDVDAPVLLLTEPNAEPWRIESESGRLFHKTGEVLLAGRVEVDRPAGPGIEPLHVSTRDLRVHQEEEYAETDQAARIEAPGHLVEGEGLQAWLTRPVRVKLLHHVRGRHELD